RRGGSSCNAAPTTASGGGDGDRDGGDRGGKAGEGQVAVPVGGAAPGPGPGNERHLRVGDRDLVPAQDDGHGPHGRGRGNRDAVAKQPGPESHNRYAPFRRSKIVATRTRWLVLRCTKIRPAVRQVSLRC